MTATRDRLPRWLAFAAIGLFLVYAANFLYFFVDDEAIPYVYAQNVLNRHGLAYNIIEGPAEGYSDFLHVWLCTLILALVRGLHLSKILVFFIGKGVSLAAGAAVIGVRPVIWSGSSIRTTGCSRPRGGSWRQATVSRTTRRDSYRSCST